MRPALALKQQPDVRIAAFEASSDGLLVLSAESDADAAVTDAIVLAGNRRAAEYIGCAVEDIAGQRLLTLMPSFAVNGGWQRCLKVIIGQQPERFRMQCAYDGLDTWFHVTATPLEGGFLLNFRDISYVQYSVFEAEVLRLEAEDTLRALTVQMTAREMMEDELRHAAVTDPLTGVLNRRGFEEALRQTAAFSKRYGHPLSIIAMDLDHFKKVNDLHGHAAGDAALKAAASLVMQELRSETDFVGRVGGEEFTLLLPHTDADGAAALAERIRASLRQHPFLINGVPVPLAASFGVSQLADDHDVDRVLAEADKALYRAKRVGRNRVVVAR